MVLYLCYISLYFSSSIFSIPQPAFFPLLCYSTIQRLISSSSNCSNYYSLPRPNLFLFYASSGMSWALSAFRKLVPECL